ncbi:hypothetical protein Tco_0660393, partial [Tanacetum coccineum]
LHFGRPEFALITCMRFGTIRFCSYTSADLKFRNRVFPHKVGLLVTILDVLGVIEDEVMFGNLCDEDSVRLCLILALEVIFMGRLLTCPVDDSLFGLVENLEAWNVFPVGSLYGLQLYGLNNECSSQEKVDYALFGVEERPQLCPYDKEDSRAVMDCKEAQGHFNG